MNKGNIWQQFVLNPLNFSHKYKLLNKDYFTIKECFTSWAINAEMRKWNSVFSKQK